METFLTVATLLGVVLGIGILAVIAFIVFIYSLRNWN